MQSYLFCPYCGNGYRETQAKSVNKHCSKCGKYVFENLPAAVGAVIINDGQLLLIKRGADPEKGKWDIPGGFCNPDEHPEASIRRELIEELGVESEVTALFGVHGPTPYEYQGYLQHNCDIFYEVKLLQMDIEVGDDAADYQWFPLNALPDATDIAFESGRNVVEQMRQRVTS